MTNDTTRDRLACALEKLTDLPGVRLEPPASEDMLADAERRLGQPLPAPLRTLLSLANGLSVQHGLWRILGVRPTNGPDLVEFNRYETWKYAWPQHDLEPLLVYKLDVQLVTWAFVRGTDREVDLMLPMAEPPSPARRDFVDSIEAMATLAAALVDDDDRAILDVVRTVPPDMGVFLGTRYFLFVELDPSEVRLRPLEEVLRMSAGLWEHANRITEGTLLMAPLREEDDEGRERWRWVTNHDLPGLEERLRPGDRISHFTIDGEIPRSNE